MYIKVVDDEYLPLVVLFQDVDLLKSLEDLALDAAAGLDVVAGAGTAVDTATVDLSEGTNTNAGAKVDVTGNGSCTRKVNQKWVLEFFFFAQVV